MVASNYVCENGFGEELTDLRDSMHLKSKGGCRGEEDVGVKSDTLGFWPQQINLDLLQGDRRSKKTRSMDICGKER